MECQQCCTFHRIPHRKTFENVHRTLREPGAFPRASAECQQRRNGDNDLAAVKQSPNKTIRKISNTTAVTYTSVEDMASDGFNLYHLQRVQHFLPVVRSNRVGFREWLQRRLHILRENLFTDEAQLTRNDIAHMRNSHS
jgi:hypothetical protein